jgi:hypothetical protein
LMFHSVVWRRGTPQRRAALSTFHVMGRVEQSAEICASNRARGAVELAPDSAPVPARDAVFHVDGDLCDLSAPAAALPAKGVGRSPLCPAEIARATEGVKGSLRTLFELLRAEFARVGSSEAQGGLSDFVQWHFSKFWAKQE